MTQEDAEDMHRLALGGSPAVSGDASEPSEWRLRDEGQPQYLDGCRAQFSIERGKPYPFSDTIAYVFDEADAKQIMQALASQASPAKRGSAKVMLRCVIDEMRDQASDTGHFDLIDDWADRLESTLAQSAPSEKLAGAEAVRSLANEIVEALLEDEKDGGYDLTAGMFGAAFSKLVRRWASHARTEPQVPAGRGITDDQRHALERCLASQKSIADRIDLLNPDDPYASLMLREDIELLDALASLQPEAAGAAQPDDWKAWYEEAMVASNEAGCVGMSAAETIRHLDSELASLQPEAAGAAQPSEAKIRSAFEAHMRSIGWDGGRMHGVLANGNYAWSALNQAWMIWQAALAQSAPSEKLAGAELAKALVDAMPHTFMNRDTQATMATVLNAALASHAQTVPVVAQESANLIDNAACTSSVERESQTVPQVPAPSILEEFKAGVAFDMIYHGDRRRVTAMGYQRPGVIWASAGRMLPVVMTADGKFGKGDLIWLERASLQPEAAGAAQPSEAEIEHWRTAATELRGMTRFNLNMPRIREAARFLEDACLAARTPTDAGGAK